MTTWWNITQALAWIATGNESIVDLVAIDAGMNEPHRTIPCHSLSAADLRITLEATYEGVKIRVGAWDARSALCEACGSGTIEMRGRLRGAGDPEAIPKDAWSILIIRDAEGQRPIRVAPKREDGTASWWTDLRLVSAEVRAQWPADAPEAGAGVSPKPNATEWAVGEMVRRKKSNESRLRDAVVLALRFEYPDIGVRKARDIFKNLSPAFKTGRGRRANSGKSGQN
jgi:hypothetical protein